MSITISTDVFCDNCVNWNDSGTVSGGRPAVREAENNAKRDGYHKIAPNYHLCKKCWGESKGYGGEDD